jgi:hypothetical protein
LTRQDRFVLIGREDDPTVFLRWRRRRRDRGWKVRQSQREPEGEQGDEMKVREGKGSGTFWTLYVRGI